MTWSVIWSDKSKKQLKKLDKKIADRIIDGVEDIKEDPYTAVNRLTKSHFFRLRGGDYRVILELKNQKMIIFVVKVAKRSRVYQ
jgi:mRNA interferase RelE/StbE